MLHPYADLQSHPQPLLRDAFKRYFKRNLKNKSTSTFKLDTRTILHSYHHGADIQALEQGHRPRLSIAIVTETWPPEINGVALSLQQLCKGLQQLGHQILLIRPTQKLSCLAFKPDQECLVRAQSIPKYQGLQFGWPQYAKVSQAIEDFAPDLIHVVTEGPLGLTALQMAKRHRIPVSSGFHSPFQDFSRFFDLVFLLKPIQHYLRWFHNNTQLTCVPSIDTERALRNFGVHCPLVVVGRGVDTACFSPQYRCQKLRSDWGVGDDTTVLLSVGRLSPEKEIDVLIETFATLKQQQNKVKLVIVGDGPDSERLQQLSQRLELKVHAVASVFAQSSHSHKPKNKDESLGGSHDERANKSHDECFDENITSEIEENIIKSLKPNLKFGEQYAQKSQVDQDIIFTGSLRGEALARAYASADVFLFASQVETFGNVVLEAMASGLPVIAFDYACAQQYVIHQYSGWLSPRGDQATFKQMILNLPHSKVLHQMGECAVQATQDVGWQIPVKQLESAFYQVAKTPL